MNHVSNTIGDILPIRSIIKDQHRTQTIAEKSIRRLSDMLPLIRTDFFFFNDTSHQAMAKVLP